MKYTPPENMICAFCGIRPASQWHHAFSQTVQNVKHYGRKLIDAPFNRFPACGACNGSHANIPRDYRWSENEFRRMAKLNGYKLPESMKSFKGDE